MVARVARGEVRAAVWVAEETEKVVMEGAEEHEYEAYECVECGGGGGGGCEVGVDDAGGGDGDSARSHSSKFRSRNCHSLQLLCNTAGAHVLPALYL